MMPFTAEGTLDAVFNKLDDPFNEVRSPGIRGGCLACSISGTIITNKLKSAGYRRVARSVPTPLYAMGDAHKPWMLAKVRFCR
jgi:hypothetical protein